MAFDRADRGRGMIPDWFWDLDKQLNEVALDVALAVILAAAVTESLRFVFGALQLWLA